MSATELVLGLLSWLWGNPWAIFVLFFVVAGLALWARRVFSPDYFYVRGLPRCNKCLDGTKSKHKVAYQSREMAMGAAERYQRKYGRQWPYRAECGYWHLTSQNPGVPRRRSVRR